MLRIGILIILIILPLQLNAHSPLEFSEPKNGSVLNAIPESLLLSFKSPTKLIKVSLNGKDSKEKDTFFQGLFKSNKSMESVLNDQISTEFAEKFVLKLPPLSVGHFKVKWRAMSEDGHIVKGDFSFIIEEN